MEHQGRQEANLRAAARPISVSAGTQLALIVVGAIFMIGSLACIVSLIWWLLNTDKGSYPGATQTDALLFYFGSYLPSIILLISAIMCAFVGYIFLNSAGALNRDAIPANDRGLLNSLLLDEKDKGIDLYVRLSSLSGITGFFTRVGITGLPLATITLTLFFAILGVFSTSNSTLFDLANLTLGAFLGSYVQRNAPGRPDSVPPGIQGP